MARKDTKSDKTPKSKTTKVSSASTASGRRVRALNLRRGITEQGLKNLNLLTAILLAVQASLFFGFAQPSKGSQMVTTGYLGQTVITDGSSTTAYTPAAHRLFDISVAYTVGVLLILAALFCLAAGSIYRKNYETGLTRRISTYRWLAVSILGSVATATIALLLGVSDLSLLIMLMAAVWAASLAGYWIENRSSQGRRAFLPAYVGAKAYGLVWLVFAIYAVGSVIHSDGLPGYLWGVLGSMLVLSLLAMVSIWRDRKINTVAEYFAAERRHIVLGFVTLSALAWQIFFGTLK
jgi:hypothetical protein